MEKSTFIDWISITHKTDGDLLPETVNRSHTQGKARNGYTECKSYLNGIMEMFNPQRPDMGIHIVYTGKALQATCEQSGMTRDDILLHHLAIGGKPSRIDVALDIENSGMIIDELWKQLETKQAKTLSSHSRSQSGNGKGYTLYVGSRKTRKKMLRIYDKAAEQGWDFVDYKRIELEMRQEVCRNFCGLYLEGGLDTGIIEGSIRGVCDFPDDKLWNSIFDYEASKLPVGTTGDGDTETWLLKQVAPALARVIAFKPQFIHRFMKAVEFHKHNSIITENPDK